MLGLSIFLSKVLWIKKVCCNFSPLNLIVRFINHLNFKKQKNYQDMSRKAANIISAQIIMKPDAVLGLATGSSPIGTYKQLIDEKLW